MSNDEKLKHACFALNDCPGDDNFSMNKKNKVNFNFNFKKKTLIYDSSFDDFFGDSFVVFKSINGIYYIIYANKKNNIITYDLIHYTKINEIYNSDEKSVIHFKHYSDKINKRDLLLTFTNRNIKLWDIRDYKCLVKIKLETFENDGYNVDHNFEYACCLFDDKKVYFILAIYCYGKSPIRVFDLKGNKVKEFDMVNCDPDDVLYFVDIFYDNNLNKKYIIAGGRDKCKSYDYNNNKLYNIYMNKKINSDEEDRRFTEYHSLVINNKDGQITLLAADRHINIWDFLTGKLLYKIDYEHYDIPGLCLWNSDYLFVGSGSIIIIDLNKKEIIKVIEAEPEVNCIKMIDHPVNGKCILTRGGKANRDDETIKIWTNWTK